MQFRTSIVVILLLILGIPLAGSGDYLEVRRAATLKDAPDREATVLVRPEVGTKLLLLDDGEQRYGYYHARYPVTGITGWIYRTLVRRYPGAIPWEMTAVAGDPLMDPTYQPTAQDQDMARDHLSIGKPQAVYERIREGYVAAQDARLKIPLWVQYQLGPRDLIGETERTDDYRPDYSIPYGARAELSDYRDSGFDRGHLAPAADMIRSESAMSESFLLSNMAPQTGIGFNRHLWAELEAAVRGWVEQRGTLTIITGPVFAVQDDSVRYRVIGDRHVAVPTHFYKIIVDANDQEDIRALAFLIPNQQLTGRDIGEFVTSIDHIEEQTGLDFLSAVLEDQQTMVEAQTAQHLW